MVTFISHSVAQTQALGETWGRDAVAGMIIGLSGDLGAGKTQLVKGLATGLDSPARVHSPTFALLNEYCGGRLPLYHLDLYRLDSVDQIIGAGLEEYLRASSAVTVVEWAERWFGDRGTLAPATRVRLLRWVRIAIIGESERRIQYEDFGH
jgi:tRNA threonylcarbamoyladenosine biosynthesis protein TsaE